MKKEQQKSNIEKSVSGNKYEKGLYQKLRLQTDVLKIRTLNRQKKFYYDTKTPAEKIAEAVMATAKKDGTYSSKTLEKAINAYIEANAGKPIRDAKRYFKRADITFKTVNKYFVNGKLSDVRVIIDTTTSARGDRIKAKAQDAAVYNSFKFPFIYLIVMPNEQYFVDNDYAKPANEDKMCKNEIYNHNFCNLYKEENVTLILQENDLIDFLTYISKRKEKDLDKLIANWKKNHFKDMHEKRKKDIAEYKLQLKEEVEKLLKK